MIDEKEVKTLVTGAGDAIAAMVNEMEKGQWMDNRGQLVQGLPCMRDVGVALLIMAKFAINNLNMMPDGEGKESMNYQLDVLLDDGED